MTHPSSTFTADDVIGGETSHALLFSVNKPGHITVSSAPTTHPVHSETGALGSLLLFRPGTAGAIAHSAPSKLADTSIALSYNATAADAALGASWSCRVTNLTLDTLTWHTVITGVSPPPVATASVDIALINRILEVIVAALHVQIHLETNGDPVPATRFAYSTEDNGLPNTRIYTKFIPDVSDSGGTWRLSVDSDPAATTVALDSDPLQFMITINFVPAAVALKSLSTLCPDISFLTFQIGLAIGFDGTITPSCFVETDPSSMVTVDIASSIQAKVIENLKGIPDDPTFGTSLQPDALKAALAKYLAVFLRLQPTEAVKAYRSDGVTLYVDHAVAPHVHPPGGVGPSQPPVASPVAAPAGNPTPVPLAPSGHPTAGPQTHPSAQL
jgi:hypothetical protein